MNNILSNIKPLIAKPSYFNSYLHQLFEAQVELTPNAIAVSFAGEQLTYHELNCRANQLANYLISLNIDARRVGILMEQSLLSFVAILGVLKSGAACVPFNLKDDFQHLDYLLKDADVDFCISLNNSAFQQIDNSFKIIAVGQQWSSICKLSQENLVKHSNKLEDLACIIYTPKFEPQLIGVEIEHSAVINLAKALSKDIYQHYPQQLKIAFHDFTHVDNFLKLIVPLISGHSICIIPQDIELDMSLILKFVDKNQINILDCNLTCLNLLISSLLLADKSSLKAIAIDREVVDRSTWNLISQNKRIDVYNLYGAVECTTNVAISKIDAKQIIPTIGRSLLNTQIYILDENLQAVPIGVTGELYIGGAQIARGYFNNTKLTAENFVVNPFDVNKQSYLYKTRDKGRYLAKGNIEYLGKIK